MTTPFHLLPPNEAERLRALQIFDVAAALTEPIFQELVGLVARIYQLPIAFITAVAAQQTDFLAVHGVPGLDVLPREQSLCSLAVSQGNTVSLNNMLTSATTLHQQTAQQLGLEAYAGVPITVAGDHAVGVFCISSTVPREFSPEELLVLEDLAALVGQLVAVRQQLLAREAMQQWQAVQQIAHASLQELDGLLSYLTQRQHMLIPTAPALLQSVRQRLREVQELLQDAA